MRSPTPLARPQDFAAGDAPADEQQLLKAMKIFVTSGEVLCLLDAPAEGRAFLETAIFNIAGEPGKEQAAVPKLLEVEKALQAVHAHFKLVGANLHDFNGRSEVVRASATSYDRLARICFMNGDPLKAMLCVYRGVNLGEMLGVSDELAKAYATLAFVAKVRRPRGERSERKEELQVELPNGRRQRVLEQSGREGG